MPRNGFGLGITKTRISNPSFASSSIKWKKHNLLLRMSVKRKNVGKGPLGTLFPCQGPFQRQLTQNHPGPRQGLESGRCCPLVDVSVTACVLKKSGGVKLYMDILVLPPLKRASQSMCHLPREEESHHSFLFLFPPKACEQH